MAKLEQEAMALRQGEAQQGEKGAGVASKRQQEWWLERAAKETQDAAVTEGSGGASAGGRQQQQQQQAEGAADTRELAAAIKTLANKVEFDRWEQRLEGEPHHKFCGASAKGQQQQGAASGQVRTEKTLLSVVVGGAIAPSTCDQPRQNWVSKPDQGRDACTTTQGGAVATAAQGDCEQGATALLRMGSGSQGRQEEPAGPRLDEPTITGGKVEFGPSKLEVEREQDEEKGIDVGAAISRALEEAEKPGPDQGGLLKGFDGVFVEPPTGPFERMDEYARQKLQEAEEILAKGGQLPAGSAVNSGGRYRAHN